MLNQSATQQHLVAENEDLRVRLAQAETALGEMRSGEVDALVVSDVGGVQLFAPANADQSFRILVGEMSEGALTMTAEGVIVYANRHLAGMLKTPLEKVIGSAVRTWIAPDSQPILQSLLEKGAGEERRAELMLAASDGSGMPVHLSVSNLPIEGRPDAYCLVAMDLTEHKRTEAIAASERVARDLLAAANQSRGELLRVIEDKTRAEADLRRFSSAMDASADAIYLVDRETMRFTHVNEAACRMQSATREQLMALGPAALLGTSRTELERTYDAIIASGVDPEPLEVLQQGKDGSQVWIELRRHAQHSGERWTMVTLARDITERKHSEEAMRESELRFAGAFEDAPIGMALVAPDGRWLKVNRALCELLGYSEAELLILTFQDLTHRDDLGQDMAHVERLKSGETSAYQMEKRYVHSSGQIVSALLSVSIVRSDAGQPRYFISQVQDITERKASEKAIDHAMQRLSKAQSIGKIGDWEYDVATQAIGWSPEVFRIFGRDPSLGPPRDYAEHSAQFDAESRVVLKERVALVIESGRPQDYELVAQRPDGASVHVHAVAVPVKDQSGRVVGVYGTVQDVSARKQLEGESLQLARRLTTTLDSMSDAFLTLDRDWCFTFINRQAAQLLGRQPEELIGRNLWAEYPTAVGSQFEREYRRAMADNVTVEFEEYFELLEIYVSVSAYPSEQGLAVYFSDVTQSRRAADVLRESEADFRALAEAMPQIVWTTRADGWNTYFNQQWMDYTGLSLEDSLGHGWSQPFHPDDRDAAARAWQQATDTVGTYAIEARLRRADGVYRWWLIRGVPVRDADGQVIKWFGTCTDVHDLKVAELEITRVNQDLRESEARVKRLNRVYAVLSQITALIVRKPGRDELFSESCRVAVEVGDFRFAWIGLVDRNANLLTPIASAGEVTDFYQVAPREIFDCQPGTPGRAGQAVRERRPQVMNDFECDGQWLVKKEMESRGIHSFSIIPLLVQGEAIGVFALYAREAGFFDAEEMRLLEELGRNISLAIENIEKRARLDYLAYYDPLTGLANRALFLDRLSQHIRSAASGGLQLALFLIDLERFKNINDSLGWPAGDAVLMQVAKWMTLRGGDPSLLARVGTNHFAALVPQVRANGDLARLIERTMVEAESHPVVIEGAVLRITAKVGVAVFPEDGGSAEILFQHAEAALKQAKASGDRYLFHTNAMTDSVAGKLSLENQLRRALDNEEFVLHYQPKANLASGKVTSAEALIRWNDPDKGLIPPGQFIPVLEETGLIHEVGRWAMRKAIEDYLRWCDAGLRGVRIAVNVSVLQLRSRDFVTEVAQVLAIDPRASSGLEIEITESMVMGDIDRGIASLHAIRDMGVTVALDDFGTGFSSLSYLGRLPIDTLKIDRAFINEMTATPEGLALVSTIITLGHSLGHKVVAEGVETEDQSRLLRLIACDEMQGFYFGRPVPTAAFEASYLIPTTK